MLLNRVSLCQKYKLIPNYSQEQIAAKQLSGLQWTINHILNGSPFYQKHLASAGLKSAEEI